MVQAAPELVQIAVAVAEDKGGTITKLNQPNGWNDSTPGATAAIPRPFSGGSLLWHSRIWKDIFGTSHANPLPKKLTQAQTNQLVAQALGEMTVLVATVADGINTALQELSTQITTDVPALYSDIGSVVAGLAGQINQLRSAIGTGNAAAITQAVQSSEAYTRAQIAALSKGLGVELSNLTHDIQHETNERAAGDANTLRQAETYALNAAEFIGALANNRMNGLAATEQSDVLNLNNRITSVNTKLEQDISGAISQSEGWAQNLVNGLDVPGLRSDVNNLAGQTAQLAQEADQCLTPLCDTVTPNASQLGKLGGLLKGLEGLGIAALLSSLVAAAIADPTDAATAIVDVAGWVPNVGTELVTDVT